MILLILFALIWTASPVCAQTPAPQPFEQVRTLYAIQDEIARGKETAHAAQRTYLQSMAKSLAMSDPSVWRDPRNTRAVLGFLLSGGEPGLLRDLIANGRLIGVDDRLARGVLAYGEGRNREAQGLLRDIDPRGLPVVLAGHVALVQGILAAETDAPFAMLRFDDAILLAPGTLVEESALRRRVILSLKTGNTENAFFSIGRYLRRFPESTFSQSFFSQTASAIAEHFDATTLPELKAADAIFTAIPQPERSEFYLGVAYEALLRGKTAIAGHAAAQAEQAAATNADLIRARLYRAVAAVTTRDPAFSIEPLHAIPAAALSIQDKELRRAALLLAEAIRKPASPLPEPGTAHEPQTGSAGISRAQMATARADQLLGDKR